MAICHLIQVFLTISADRAINTVALALSSKRKGALTIASSVRVAE